MCHTHYMQVWKHGHLLEPKPVVRRVPVDLSSQVRSPMGLSVSEVREYLALDCCPVCGDGPWRAVVQHIRLKHGAKARDVRFWAGLNRTTSLISATLSQAKAEHMRAIGWKPPNGGTGSKGKRWAAAAQGLQTAGGEQVVLTNVKHGDWGRGYRLGCRCDRCRLANSERQQEMRKRRMTRLDKAKHGTRGAYTNWGCRCDLCREAHLESMETRHLVKHVSELTAQPDGGA